jgi:hypothetical protein
MSFSRSGYCQDYWPRCGTIQTRRGSHLATYLLVNADATVNLSPKEEKIIATGGAKTTPSDEGCVIEFIVKCGSLILFALLIQTVESSNLPF